MTNYKEVLKLFVESCRNDDLENATVYFNMAIHKRINELLEYKRAEIGTAISLGIK